jgi:hypothetical protein
VLGPLLPLIYINDIDECAVNRFSDDTIRCKMILGTYAVGQKNGLCSLMLKNVK